MKRQNPHPVSRVRISFCFFCLSVLLTWKFPAPSAEKLRGRLVIWKGEPSSSFVFVSHRFAGEEKGPVISEHDIHFVSANASESFLISSWLDFAEDNELHDFVLFSWFGSRQRADSFNILRKFRGATSIFDFVYFFYRGKRKILTPLPRWGFNLFWFCFKIRNRCDMENQNHCNRNGFPISFPLLHLGVRHLSSRWISTQRE